MLPPEYLDSLPSPRLRALLAQAESDTLADMARRLMTYDYYIPAAQWQHKKLQELGLLHDEITKRLSKLTKLSEKEIDQMLVDAGGEALKRDDAVYRKAGLTPSPVKTSEALRKVMNSGARQTRGTFRNIMATTAKTATGQFETALDRAWMQISTGAFDRNTAIRFAIKDLSRQGVGAIRYPTGHIDTLEVATRRAIVTGSGQTAAKLQLARAEEMGCDLVEVSAHGGARPEHAAWQGKSYSLSGKSEKYPPFSETGYGTGAGLCGWNCRHSFSPYFDGSPRTYSPELLAELERKKFTYNGQRMTEAEARAQQRYIERQIRRWKRENVAMNAAGLDTGESAAKIAYWQRAQADFLKQTGLKRQIDREMTGAVVDKISERGIIRLRKPSEDILQSMSFDEVSQYRGKLSDRAVRKWYKYHDEQIPALIDRSKPIEDQARQACDLRNQHRTQARDLMRDQEARKKLDETDPNRTFEELVADKMKRKGLTREQAYEDILTTATKTRKSVNTSLGLE